MSRFFVLLALLAACTDKGGEEDGVDAGGEVGPVDADGDGYVEGEDCDDGNAEAFPGADEVCNGVDDNCDGIVDEGEALDAATWYLDGDGDGYGDPEASSSACAQPEGTVADATDCDDADGMVFPGADEVCNGVDDNCEGTVDEDAALDALPWYLDADGDSFGDPADSTLACAAPEGRVADANDCDDTAATVYPGAPEECDGRTNDCEDPDYGLVEAPADELDDDGDTYVECTWGAIPWDGSSLVVDGDDCDDSDPTVYPGATELCDGLDNDCNGTEPLDELDDDGDGAVDCTIDAGGWDGSAAVTAGDDCDDADPVVYVGAPEICDGQYNDCADPDYDAASAPGDETDDDGDGHVECTQDGATWVGATITGYEDCDDTTASTYVGAPEYCNLVDDDCDGTTDEDDALDVLTWYADTDGDTYGDSSSTDLDCYQPTGFVSDSSDCDDTDSAVNPGATEVCNEVDDDCDGDVDDADTSLDTSTGSVFYADTDGDSYGDADSTTMSCELLSGFSSDDTDCDDTASDVNPGETEQCDTTDHDCDGDVNNEVLGAGSDCAAISCLEILEDGSSSGDGTYYLEGLTGDIFDVHCDMSRDGGGWTLIGSVVNEYHVTGKYDRNWDSYEVWTDTTTMGDHSTSTSADFKGEAYYDIEGDDYLVITDEYGFAFYDLLGGSDFATFVGDEYSTSACSETYLASGADWSEDFSSDQDSAISFIVRPKDTNADCFPDGNENAIIGHQIKAQWSLGLGNTPDGYVVFDDYDNSLQVSSYFSGTTCTAGTYPCNDIGYENGGSPAYSVSSKVIYGQIYIR